MTKTTIDKKSTADRLRKLESAVNSFRASDRAWEEEKEFYDWCKADDYRKIVDRLNNLESRLTQQQQQQQQEQQQQQQQEEKSAPNENGIHISWIPLETHRSEIEKRDKTIRAHEQRINALVDDMKRNRIMVEQFKKLMNDRTL